MFQTKNSKSIAIVTIAVLCFYRVFKLSSLDVDYAKKLHGLLIEKGKTQLLGYSSHDNDSSRINSHDICSIHSSYRSDRNMSSPLHSTLRLIQQEGGDTVYVEIRAVNGYNITKTTGGDLFILWAEQVEGDGCTSGHVDDNNNGTYFGYIKLYWTGLSIIKAKLASTVENFCIRRHAITKYGDSAFAMKNPRGIKATFKTKMQEVEETRCGNQYPLFGYKHVCTFTHLNDDSPWFCGAPISRQLTCATICDFISFSSPHIKDALSPKEREETVNDLEHRQLNKTITIMATYAANTNKTPCHKLPKEMSWTENPPSSGFYLNKTWHNLNCKNTITFHSRSYQTCLKNKTLVILGDSTTRQYVNYFMSQVLKLPKINLKNYSSFHSLIEFKNFGIHLIHKRHEQPYYWPRTRATEITSQGTEINKLAKSDIPGKDIIVVAHYCAHLLAFSSELFRFIVRRLANSIKNLLKVKHEAYVFIKGPHIFFGHETFDVRISLNQKNIIFEEFKDLKTKVIYLDTWTITAAHNSEQLHPNDPTLTSLIQQLMTYLCSN